MALLLVMGVVPTLQIARMGVTEEIAYLLAGFKIHLSSDNSEVVRIVIYYIWCVEGEPTSRFPCLLLRLTSILMLGSYFNLYSRYVGLDLRLIEINLR